MIWDEKDEQWFGVEHCKAPELLRDALLDGYRDFLEQQLTHNRRSLTETEILDIQNRCDSLCRCRTFFSWLGLRKQR